MFREMAWRSHLRHGEWPVGISGTGLPACRVRYTSSFDANWNRRHGCDLLQARTRLSNIGYEVTVCTTSTSRRAASSPPVRAEFVQRVSRSAASPGRLRGPVYFPDYGWSLSNCAPRRGSTYRCRNRWPPTGDGPRMIDTARAAGIQLGVVTSIASMTRACFSPSHRRRALGRILRRCVREVYRSPNILTPIKGSWRSKRRRAHNQAIHQVDLLLYFAAHTMVSAWQLAHCTRSSRRTWSRLLQYSSGATGVIQASLLLAGYTERVELHGTKGTAVIAATG